mmetsp:Transcript_5115/g.6946  ORF Transcript_5115/g.6946 Transcript_5115/m.6946 type:complete len:89 (-) Transcript_5115:261-527(-)
MAVQLATVLVVLMFLRLRQRFLETWALDVIIVLLEAVKIVLCLELERIPSSNEERKKDCRKEKPNELGRRWKSERNALIFDPTRKISL